MPNWRAGKIGSPRSETPLIRAKIREEVEHSPPSMVPPRTGPIFGPAYYPARCRLVTSHRQPPDTASQANGTISKQRASAGSHRKTQG